MRLVAFVTVGRSDYGLYRPILRAMAERRDVEYGLIVGGEHLVTPDGEAAIRRDGHAVLDTVEMQMAADTATATALSMGVGLSGFARSFARSRPDMIVVLGDRFEMFVAAAAAVPLGSALMHLHGGEVTEGAMDERFRHAMTKLAHLHCVATELSAHRVRQMGEEPWRVHVTGAPGLDAALAEPPLDRRSFFEALGTQDPGPYLLATYHPVTNEPDPGGVQVDAMLAALAEAGLPVICTAPNADPGSRVIHERLSAQARATAERFTLVQSLGRLYGSAMAHAEAMVGNSSSGVIEACSYGLPVVNIGSRQTSRERSANVIDCDCETGAVLSAIRRALSPEARAVARAAKNVYGDGAAGPRIAAIAAETPIHARLRLKKFMGAVQNPR